MKKIFIESLNQVVCFDSTIKSLKFKSKSNYRQISFNLFNELIYSENDVILDLNKCSLIIYNPFQISLNEKKLITGMYKELEKNIKDDEKKIIQKIEEYSFNLFDDLSLNVDYQFEYNEEIDVGKLFQTFNIRFPEIDYSNYLELLTNYMKLNSIFNKSKVIISFGLISLLNDEEALLLEKELAYNDLILLDIFYIDDNVNENKDLFIDDDWCII